MKASQHRVGIAALLALILSFSLTLAQDNSGITVAGSGIVSPIFDALTQASNVTVDVTSEVTGTRVGFERLCQGTTDVATSNRAISSDENTNCTNNNVDYTELLIAQNIVAFISAADAPYAQCLTINELNSVFAPSAQAANWNAVNPANGDTTLSVIAPAATTATFAVLDGVVEGDGLRSDATIVDNEADIAAAVAQTPGAIGAISLPLASAAGSSVRILQLNANDSFGCTTPSAEAVEQRTYSAETPLYVYVNRASLSKTGLTEVLTYMISPEAATVINDGGLVAPTATIAEANKVALEGTGNTRPFSEAATSFQIPLDVSGTVTIAGAASASDYIKNLSAVLTSQYAGLVPDTKLSGQSAGLRRMCNGEIDIVVVNGALNADQTAACDANNIKTLSIELGKQAVVLVSNAASDYLTCLTTEQLTIAWDAASANTITTWNQVDSSFPETAITLFAPTEGSSLTDILMESASGKPLTSRNDSDMRDDVLYRAAATANVEGALTYMSWGDYQKVLANNQERIQLVGVNAGNGCVVPSEATFADATYPLLRDTQLLVKTTSLTNPAVQSFLWFLASDSNYGQFEDVGLMGVNFGSLPALRQTLQKAFADAATAAQTVAEATPEATGEATAEASAEATSEATNEASTEATAEATASS
ncbi:MAG: substrate-binding domain-containing protein [Chloroflexi bacterium]|nr:substrate-binding domain-containing protein [Chloroflexota bacterium]MCC6891199.1 substrate-binding domain-containing protein [Anaerolineae bacterium]